MSEIGEMRPGDVTPMRSFKVFRGTKTEYVELTIKPPKGRRAVLMFLGDEDIDGAQPLDVVGRMRAIGWESRFTHNIGNLAPGDILAMRTCKVLYGDPKAQFLEMTYKAKRGRRMVFMMIGDEPLSGKPELDCTPAMNAFGWFLRPGEEAIGHRDLIG